MKRLVILQDSGYLKFYFQNAFLTSDLATFCESHDLIVFTVCKLSTKRTPDDRKTNLCLATKNSAFPGVLK